MFRICWLGARTGSNFGTLAGVVGVGVLLVGCAGGGDTIVSGRFGPEEPVSLQNLTVQDGRYLVSYALEVFVAAQGGPVELECTVADTTGRLARLPDLERTVNSGSWQLVGADDVFELPDLTMGIRCYPDRDVTLQVVVHDVRLDAQPVD